MRLKDDYQSYKELRDTGRDHYEASDMIDKSERTLYRYQAKYRELEEDVQDNGIYIEESDEVLEDYDSKTAMKLLIQRKQLNELRKEINQMATEKARIQMFEQIVRDNILGHSVTKLDFNQKLVRRMELDEIVMYTIADIHYGVNEDVVNSDMIENRIIRAFQMIVDDIRKNDIKQAKIAFLGDLIDGIIHQSQLIKGTMNLINQTLNMKDLLIQGLEYVLDETGVLLEVLFVTDSNHSQIRLGGKSNTDWSDQNLEILIAEYLEQYFRYDDRIVFTTGKQIEKRYFGNRYLFTHGYQNFKKLDPKVIQDKVIKNDPLLDFIVCGHYHNFTTIAIGYNPETNIERRLISAPSLVGQNEYANSIGYRNNPGILKMILDDSGVREYNHMQVREM